MEIGSLYNTTSETNSAAAQRAQIEKWRETRRTNREAGRNSASASIGGSDSQSSFDSYVERMVSFRYRNDYDRYSSSLNPYSTEDGSLLTSYNYGNSYRNPWSSYGYGDSFENCVSLIADALEEKSGISDEEKNSFTTYDAAGRKTTLSRENVLGIGKTYGAGQALGTAYSNSSQNPLSRILKFFLNRSSS